MGKPASLAKEQHRALGLLRDLPALAPFYLAGVSALTVHLGHRRSEDLDFFAEADASDLDAVASALSGAFSELVVSASTDAVLRVVADGTSLDFVRYPYALLEPTQVGPEGIPLASLRDLAAMKVAAIASRGIRRDFWDLHTLATRVLPLDVALDAYACRYGVARSDAYHVLRALTYFDDAEKEATLPRGLTRAHWETIKRWFRVEAPGALSL